MDNMIYISIELKRQYAFIFFPPRIEYVTITPDGFRYRSQIFPTVNGLFRWFKDHYQEPVPGIEALHLLLIVDVAWVWWYLANTLTPFERHHAQQQQPNKDTCVPQRHPSQH